MGRGANDPPPSCAGLWPAVHQSWPDARAELEAKLTKLWSDQPEDATIKDRMAAVNCVYAWSSGRPDHSRELYDYALATLLQLKRSANFELVAGRWWSTFRYLDRHFTCHEHLPRLGEALEHARAHRRLIDAYRQLAGPVTTHSLCTLAETSTEELRAMVTFHPSRMNWAAAVAVD